MKRDTPFQAFLFWWLASWVCRTVCASCRCVPSFDGRVHTCIVFQFSHRQYMFRTSYSIQARVLWINKCWRKYKYKTQTLPKNPQDLNMTSRALKIFSFEQAESTICYPYINLHSQVTLSMRCVFSWRQFPLYYFIIFVHISLKCVFAI